MNGGWNLARGRVPERNLAKPRTVREVRWFRAVLIAAAVVAGLVAPYPGSGPARAQAATGAGRSGDPQTAELYWVQVGVFRDAEAARLVAQRLRQRRYRVQETTLPARSPEGADPGGETVAAGGSHDRYEIVVTGGGTDDLARRVSAKGLASRGSSEGVVITPSLPLSEAVALSRELGDDGLAVRVRRVGAPSGPATRRAPTGPGSVPVEAGPRHRVRVGGFGDRAAAQAALRELEALGYRPFLTRGSE